MIHRRALAESAKATAGGLEISGRKRGNAPRVDRAAPPIFLGTLRASRFIEVHWQFGQFSDDEAWARLVKSFSPRFFRVASLLSHLAIAYRLAQTAQPDIVSARNGCAPVVCRQLLRNSVG